jgi:hypothetical protein
VQDKAKIGEKSAVYMGINEHFEPIFNAVWRQLRGFKTGTKMSAEVSRKMQDRV